MSPLRLSVCDWTNNDNNKRFQQIQSASQFHSVTQTQLKHMLCKTQTNTLHYYSKPTKSSYK